MRVKVEREWDDDVCIARSVHNRCAEFEEKETCLIKPDTGEMNDYFFFSHSFFLSSLVCPSHTHANAERLAAQSNFYLVWRESVLAMLLCLLLF